MTFHNPSTTELRDRFAEAAMHACLSNPNILPGGIQGATVEQLQQVAEGYWRMADAMLAERGKK